MNDKGLISKTTINRVTPEGKETTVETYIYDSFDETGNWTQRTICDEEKKTIKVEKRTYTYF